MDNNVRDVSTATYSDLASVMPAVTMGSETTDGATGSEETYFQHDEWPDYYKIFLANAAMHQAIMTRATWVLGKGWKADPRVTLILDMIKGDGHQSVNQILKNLIVVKHIIGDSYCEIIRDEENTIINLKVLDPSTIRVVQDKHGRIKRYEQIGKTPKDTIKFKPIEILRLTQKQIADNGLGIGDIQPVKEIIEAQNECFKDSRIIYHRYAVPRIVYKLDTDDEANISAFKTKADAANAASENIYIPKDSVDFEILALSGNQSISTIPWLQYLNDSLYKAVAIPQIIIGGENFSESAAKVTFVSFTQSLAEEQLDVIEAIWNQLYLRIKLEVPTEIRNELISDTQKDGENAQMGFQPSDFATENAGVVE